MHRTRPDRSRLFRAAVELASTGGSGFKATARRFSLCPADAEDAYQRGLEILITRAPTDERAELEPWLHTVIKHEALAIRRQRERMHGSGRPSPLEPRATEDEGNPEERAPERERAIRTAEALSQLKQSEIQCLLLKALGYSYDEISTRTGFSWTNVNRSLTEGRRRFFDGFAQIESGQRCGRFRSLLSAAGDGEAATEDEQLLRAHLRGCPACRAALRDYRALPERLAELLPPLVLLPALQKGSWWSRAHDALSLWTADRGSAIGHKLQQVGEGLSAQKATAVVASTATLTGGGAVIRERAADDRGPNRPAASRPADSGPPQDTAAAPSPVESPPAATPRPVSDTTGSGASGSEPRSATEETAEFAPDGAGPAPPAGEAPAREAASGPGATSASAGTGKRPAGGQEFGP